MKNVSPRTIALVCAIGFSLITTCCVYLFESFAPSPWVWLAGVLLITFVLAFGIVYIALEHFIYRKIKLIYKTIHDLKTPKAEKQPLDMDKDILTEVKQEVAGWAKKSREEIAELKQMENYRKEFVGNVSHELKTPIFNIQGYIHTLLDGGIEDEEINQYYLKKASASVDRLCAIVEDLETITRFEAGELKLDREVFDIHLLASDVFDSMEMRAQAKDITLDFKEGCDQPFFVYADKSRIRQVLVNLVSNAIKYGKQGGEVLVGLYDMDEHILTEVSDNGTGIAQEHLNRLFERFYRVDSSRAREQGEGGTGLGLAIVKHILEAHNQTINVRSQPEVGTTFGFTLEKAKE